MATIEEIEHRWAETGRLIALLALLEHAYPQVIEEIKGTKISGTNLLNLVAYALDFDSRHWADKAVTWIESGFPIDAEICDRLLKISASKNDTQALRHRSLKQAKRWQRATAT